MKPIFTLLAGLTALGVFANSFESQADIKDIQGEISLDDNVYCFGKRTSSITSKIQNKSFCTLIL